MESNRLYDFVMRNPEGTGLPGIPIIREDLDLSCKKITWLPAPLIVDGDMILTGCQCLKKLPKNLFVNGSLYIVGTQIRELSNRLIVLGDIVASGLELKIPSGFTTNGSLYLGCLPGQSPGAASLYLGDDITINGDLDISNRIVKRPPKNLTIRGRLISGETDCDKIFRPRGCFQECNQVG